MQCKTYRHLKTNNDAGVENPAMSAPGYEQTLRAHLSDFRTTPQGGHRTQLFGTILARSSNTSTFPDIWVEVVRFPGAEQFADPPIRG